MTLNLPAHIVELNADVLAGAKAARLAGAPRVSARADPYKSGLERRFAHELADTLFVPGAWKYEGVTLHLAGGRYTVDFFGQLADGRGLAGVEVKGWGKSLDRSKAKFRAAVQEHRWLIFGWCIWSRKSGWSFQWYG